MTGDKNAFTRCFKLVTGSSNDKHDHGFLTVLLDRGNGYIIEKASAYYKLNSVVYDECLPFGTKLAIENKNKDAWAGTITVDGNSMTCTNCDQGKSTLKIVCDGNDDGHVTNPTKCLNGKRCFLEPKSRDIVLTSETSRLSHQNGNIGDSGCNNLCAADDACVRWTRYKSEREGTVCDTHRHLDTCNSKKAFLYMFRFVFHYLVVILSSCNQKTQLTTPNYYFQFFFFYDLRIELNHRIYF